jgi:hypothetical protein
VLGHETKPEGIAYSSGGCRIFTEAQDKPDPSSC